MTAVLLPNGKQQYLTTAGLPAVGYKLATFAAGTSTPQVTWQDALKVAQQTNPIILDGRGEASIFWEGAYKVQLQDSTGAVIWTQDNLQSLPNGYTTSLVPAVTNSVDLGSVTLSWRNLYLGPNNAPVLDTVSGNLGYFARTSGEINALPNPVTPVNFSYPAQTGVRYGPNTTPGTTDMANALQAAIDSASPSSTSVQITAQNGLSKPLLIRSTTQQSTGINGNGRVSTILQPLTTSIATAPVSINALIINQNSNESLRLAHLRQFDASGYTGYFMYAVPGGGADGSCKPAFSMVVDDCWFSPASTNSGIFYGFFSNLQMVDCVFESTKNGCIVMVAGTNPSGSSSDILATNITMNACFDSFLFGSVDALVKAMLTVNGLHAYGHLRGPIMEITNGQVLKFNNISVEADPGNFGSVGLFKLTDCITVQGTNSSCKSRSGVPQGAIAIQVINGQTGKYSNIVSDCLVGVQFSGAGVVDVTFDNCDFSGTQALPINIGLQISGSTQSGQAIFRNCRFNFANFQNFIHSSGANTMNWLFYGCEFLNAGMNATGTNYNIDIALAGNVLFDENCKFGQTSGTAAATHYLNANGAGTVAISDPIVTGAIPGGGLFKIGSQALSLDGVDSSMPGMPPFIPTLGGTATYTAQQGQYSVKNKMVFYQGRLTVNVIGTGSPNTISGLPITSNATIYGGGFAHFLAGSNTNVTAPPTMSISPGGTSATMRGFTAAAAGSTNISPFTSGTDMIFSGSYPL